MDGLVDELFWNYEFGNGVNNGLFIGWGNNELQYYIDCLVNIKVEGGMLYIIVFWENFEGVVFIFVCIIIKGKVEQCYGCIEVCMQLLWGQGFWLVFWMLGSNIDEVGWLQCGEIDIMEYCGQDFLIFIGSVYGLGYFVGDVVSKEYVLFQDWFDMGFYIFGIEWGLEYINYYVDDVLYNQIIFEDVEGEWVFDQLFYIFLNLVVGGNFVGVVGFDIVFL